MLQKQGRAQKNDDRTLTEDMPDKAKETYMACLVNVAVKIRKQEEDKDE